MMFSTFQSFFKLIIIAGLSVFFIVFSNRLVHAVVQGNADQSFIHNSVMVLDNRGNVCSGVVVRQDVVLTAAHCVATASDWRIHWRDENNVPILVQPKHVKIHPQYNTKAIKNRSISIDMALVKLPEPLPSQFWPIALSDVQELSVGDSVIVAGYGLSDEKNSKALGKFRSATLSVIEPYGKSKIILWLEDPLSAGAGGCHGDSGGPLIHNGSVIGITAWTTGKGRSDCGVYTQGALISPQRDWIESVIKSWF